MTCCLYIHSSPRRNAYCAATLSSLCLRATLCADSTIKKRSSKETRNEKPEHAPTCGREINAIILSLPCLPLTPRTSSPTCACLLVPTHTHQLHHHHNTTLLQGSAHIPISPEGLVRLYLPIVITFLKLSASLSLVTFQIFHNFTYSIP